jgi:hypothetical protein
LDRQSRAAREAVSRALREVQRSAQTGTLFGPLNQKEE